MAQHPISHPTLDRVDETTFRVGATTFVAAPFDRFPSTPDRFCVVKPPDLIERWARLLAELRPQRIVELGICRGGSTALIGALSTPERMVAIELADERVDALDVFIEQRGLVGAVEPHYGIDQSDRHAVESALASMDGRPIDLVVDDASHDLDLTRESFNLLFPRLRAGGLFVVEDWAWAHEGFEARLPDSLPLTSLVFEAILSLPYRRGVIDDVRIDRDWAVIRRGSAPIDDGFDLSASYGERGKALFAPGARGAHPGSWPGSSMSSAAAAEAFGSAPS
jgi:hypothetical protein